MNEIIIETYFSDINLPKEKEYILEPDENISIYYFENENKVKLDEIYDYLENKIGLPSEGDTCEISLKWEENKEEYIFTFKVIDITLEDPCILEDTITLSKEKIIEKLNEFKLN